MGKRSCSQRLQREENEQDEELWSSPTVDASQPVVTATRTSHVCAPIPPCQGSFEMRLAVACIANVRWQPL